MDPDRQRLLFFPWFLTIVLLNPDLSFFKNTVDPDQLASDEAILSEPTLFSTLIVNTYCFSL